MDLSIIVVNWNSEKYLQQCIASVFRWTHDVSFEIIVVDNASPAGNIDSLKAQFPEIKLIKSENNLGFSGANNLGFRHSTGEYLLFLNPDTKLDSPAIDMLLRQAKALRDAGVVGCRLLNGDLSIQTTSIRKFPRIWNLLSRIEYLRQRFPKLCGIGALFSSGEKPVAVEAISGACMLLRRDVFRRIGTFSEDYFMYSEDVDLCFQAIRAGFHNYYVGTATIVHYGGTSSPRAWQIAMQIRAELYFCQKHYGRFYALWFRFAMIVNASARLMFLTVLHPLAAALHTSHSIKATQSRWLLILKTLVAQPTCAAKPPVLSTTH